MHRFTFTYKGYFMPSKQILITVRFQAPSDLSGINLTDIEAMPRCTGHQFFNIDGTNNVIMTPAHNMASAMTYVITSQGIYDSIIGRRANRGTMSDGKEFLKSVKYESKKVFKDHQFSIRKTRNKNHVPEDNGYKVACFTILEDDLPTLRKSDFFGVLVSFLEGKSSEFLGSIDGLPVSPVRFGTSLRGTQDVILESDSVSVVRLSNGENYTCHAVETLLSKPPVIERVDGAVRKDDTLEDIGMGLYLRALGYVIKKEEKPEEEYEHVY